MGIYEVCEQSIGLVRGKRLILSTEERTALEDLDYERLTSLHAQDEAVICVLHFERVRDRLLQIYPWTFARKTAAITGGILPSDCLTLLCVEQDGSPVEYEQTDARLNITGSITVHYTSRVTEVSSWSAIFKDVFCYSLAVEICSAVTGKPEYIQLLEQKVQELIHRAYQIGAIKAETRLTHQEELYNRAIGLSRGQRSVKETSTAATEQGLDTSGYVNERMTAEYQACIRASDRVRDRLLEGYAWLFARKSAKLTGRTSTLEGWQKEYELPSDCVKVLCLLSGDEAVEYEECGGKLHSNAENPTLRYTARITDKGEWASTFVDVYVYVLAQEIILATTRDLEAVQLLESRAQQLIHQAYRMGAIREETKLPLKEELYERAKSLVYGQRTIKESSDVSVTQGLDNAGELNSREMRANEICRKSSGSIRDRLLQLYAWEFAKRSVKPESTETISGWTNGYVLPSDCLKVLTVLNDGEAIDWEVSNGKVYCNGENITLRYTARQTDITQWVGAFRDAFCYSLAVEIATSTIGASELETLLEQKLQKIIKDAYQIGAIKIESRIPMKEELFNRAIGLVKGIRTVKSDEKTTRYEDEVSACYRSYETLRDRLLQIYPWVFARKTETPAQLSESVPGWKYTYILPEDCVKVLSVIAEDKRATYGQEYYCRSASERSGKIELTDYEVAGNELYANHAPVYVRYTSRITDSKKWVSSFKDALVILIAIEICHNVTDAEKLAQILEQRLLVLIKEAQESGIIRAETGLKLLRDSGYTGIREVPYMDYSGLPTLACSPLNYCCEGSNERIPGEFFIR